MFPLGTVLWYHQHIDQSIPVCIDENGGNEGVFRCRIF